MLNKIAVVAVGLLTLAGMSASYCQAAGTAPSIMDLEAFARAAEPAAVGADQQIAEAEEFFAAGQLLAAQHILQSLDAAALTPEQARRVGRLAGDINAAIQARERAFRAEAERERPERRSVRAQASDFQEELHRDWVVQQELRKWKAVELAQQAHHALYYERDPQDAVSLAAEALYHDPTNLQAQEILTQARVELGDEEAIQKFEVETVIGLPELRRGSAIQTLANSRAAAQRHYAEGEFGLALEEARRALISVEALSVYMDVRDERQETEDFIDLVERDYEEHKRRLEAERRREAEDRAEQWARDAAAQSEQERGREVDEVRRLTDEAQFDEVEAMLRELAAEDPADDLVRQMQMDAVKRRASWETDRLNALRHENDLMLEVLETETQVLPRNVRTYDFPDLAFWREVVEKRDPGLYPSRAREPETPEDAVVWQQLEESLPFQFLATPIQQVVDYLNQTTPPTYVLFSGDIALPEGDQAPVTLSVETEIRNGLDQICSMLNLAWTVEDGIVKIAAAERLRKYEYRIYPVADLMTSFRDFTTSDIRGTGGRGGRGVRGGGGGGGGGGGFNPQYSFFDDDTGRDALPAGRTGGAGRAGQQQAFGLLPEAQSLVVLIKELCGRDTWRATGASGVIDAGTYAAAGGARGGAAPQAGPVGTGAFGLGPGPAAGFELTPGAALPELAPSGEVFVLAHDPTQFIIYQTAEVHDCIERLLRDLRTRRTILIALDMRTISIASDFMREVGFEWEDFVLADQNLGNGMWNSLEGFGLTSGSGGGFGTFVMPGDYEVVWTPDPDDPTEGEYTINYLEGPAQWMGWLGSITDWDNAEVDEDGNVTFSPPFTEGPASAAGTGLPWIPELQRFGTTLNIGWENDLFHLSGFFRMAHKHHAMTRTSWTRLPLTNGQANEIYTETDQWYIANYSVDENVLIPELESAPSGSGVWARAVVGPDLKYVWLELQPRGDIADLSQTAEFATFVGQPGGGEGGAAGELVINEIVLPTEIRPDVQASVVCPDRGSVVLGGTIDTTRQQDEAGVPILDKIPILKRFFSSKGEALESSAFFYVARPQIVLMDEEERRIK
jgi:hypothetical protein